MQHVVRMVYVGSHSELKKVLKLLGHICMEKVIPMEWLLS